MGCCGGRRDDDDLADVKAEQKWSYITLSDFKTSSCFAPFSYGILYITIFTSIAVYGVDSFTAINLLVFSRWSSQIKPKIPFTISKWIFAGCIILSFVLLAYRWIRAIRVIRSGGVAPSYLDPVAVRIQSTRMGSEGQGYRRFLVFAELTKSRKGADYVALFTYFNFEASLRVIFAEGPRQVINAMTLYSVMQLNLIPTGHNAAPADTSPVKQFFINIKVLAEKDRLQATILFAMLFTLVIWVVSILSLAVSVILYVVFLWHHIPTEDGTLKTYCRRKINRRLERIVKRKVNKALAKGLALQDRTRADLEPGLDGSKRQPTLPNLGYTGSSAASDISSMPGLSRQTTTTTLPPYSRAPPSVASFPLDRKPTLPDMKLDSGSFTSSTPAPQLDDTASLVNNAQAFGYNASTPYPTNGPPAWPERYGTPVSSMSDYRPPTAQAAQRPRTPLDPFARGSPAPENNFGRRPPFSPSMPDRSMTAPIPSATPDPSYRNFTRPWPAPVLQQGPRMQTPGPPRAGTAPPPQGGPFNPNFRY
ncbi:Potassium transporter [Ophidiomyces ophidiicola]|nr:Potassium transporter [Ophidiomyces ophidiicola]KAI1991040.1 Potassium transporter [Ophidiomyces ophidiicola]